MPTTASPPLLTPLLLPQLSPPSVFTEQIFQHPLLFSLPSLCSNSSLLFVFFLILYLCIYRFKSSLHRKENVTLVPESGLIHLLPWPFSSIFLQMSFILLCFLNKIDHLYIPYFVFVHLGWKSWLIPNFSIVDKAGLIMDKWVFLWYAELDF